MPGWRGLAAVAGAAASVACTHTGTVGLLSDGDLAGRVIDPSLAREVVEGESCGPYQYLASAFRRALEGTDYDTLIDVEVTTTTALFVVQNCLHVKGRALRSRDLPRADAAEARAR